MNYWFSWWEINSCADFAIFIFVKSHYLLAWKHFTKSEILTKKSGILNTLIPIMQIHKDNHFWSADECSGGRDGGGGYGCAHTPWKHF